MSTYEEFMIILTACSLLIAILNYTHENSTSAPAKLMRCYFLTNHYLTYFITIFISTRECWFYSVFRYLSSDLLHFYSKF